MRQSALDILVRIANTLPLIMRAYIANAESVECSYDANTVTCHVQSSRVSILV